MECWEIMTSRIDKTYVSWWLSTRRDSFWKRTPLLWQLQAALIAARRTGRVVTRFSRSTAPDDADLALLEVAATTLHFSETGFSLSGPADSVETPAPICIVF